MPSKPKKAAVAARVLPSIPKEWIDQFVTGPMSEEAVNDVSVAFKKALIERAMGAELSHHLGYSPGAAKPDDASNHRNDSSGKTVRTDDGPLRIEVPRDRDGSFEPVLIPKHQRRFTGFDDNHFWLRWSPGLVLISLLASLITSSRSAAAACWSPAE